MLPHQLIVLLGHLPMHRACRHFPRCFIVIDDFDVVVRVTSRAIGVSNDERIAVRVQPLRKFVPQTVDRLDVIWISRIELRRLKTLDQAQRFNFSPMSLRHRLGMIDKFFDAASIAQDRRNSICASRNVLTSLLRALATQDLVLDC